MDAKTKTVDANLNRSKGATSLITTKIMVCGFMEYVGISSVPALNHPSCHDKYNTKHLEFALSDCDNLLTSGGGILVCLLLEPLDLLYI